MAYTPATKLPTIAYFQWSRPDAPNPRLAQAINNTDTTLVFSDPPLDHAGAVFSLGFLMGIKNEQSYTETIYVPPGALSSDGLTATGVVRGIRLEGLDFTTGDPTLTSDFNVDDPVYCNISAVNFLLMTSAMQGVVASGGINWKIGRELDEDITVFAQNADVNKPFWQYDAATNQWIYSNDGVNSMPFGTGSGLVGSNSILISAGAISAILDPSGGLQTTGVGIGLTSAASGALIPTGAVLPFAGSSAPTGYLLCDGTAVSRATYATLFALIGTTYGVGDGSTTFNVPDLRGRAAYGKAAAGTYSALNNSGGAETVTLTTTELPAHTHDVNPGYYTPSNFQNTSPSGSNSTPYGGGASPQTTTSTGSGAAFAIRNNYLVLNYVIKT